MGRVRRGPLVVGAGLVALALVVAVLGAVVAAGPGDVVARSADEGGGVDFVADDGAYTIYAVVPVDEHGRLTDEGQQEEAVRGLRCTVERPGEAEPLEIDGGPVVFEHVGEATSVGWFSTSAGAVAVSCATSVPVLVRAGRVGGPAGVARTVVAPALGLVGLVLVVMALRPWVSALVRRPPPPPASET